MAGSSALLPIMLRSLADATLGFSAGKLLLEFLELYLEPSPERAHAFDVFVLLASKSAS